MQKRLSGARLLSFFAALAAFAVGCGQANLNLRSAIQPREEVRAPSGISASFLVEHSGTEDVRLGISKASLDKEFLLQASLIDQSYAPMWNGLKSRVVAFQRRDDRLFMLEASKGHQLHNDLDQYLLLAAFPILEETETHIFFDFDAGMSKIFVIGDWRAHDFEGPWYQANSWVTAKTDLSFIQQARLIGDERLEVTQVTQVGVPNGSGATAELPYVVRYNLTAYEPDTAFTPVISKSFDKVGFFEVAPQLKLGGGDDLVLASKWNTAKPVVYAISANTPADYRQALADGVLYWNKAFGREVVKVIDAPATVTAPDYDYNVVQWIDFPNAGFAYADAQMDPRSGEILHASVFMASAFAVGGKAQARRLLLRLQAEDRNENARQARPVSLAGFATDPMCRHDGGKRFRASLERLLADDVDDAVILKLSQDYMREVVAHEVGHTLGLRHNFAGSQASNFPLSARAGIVKQYLETGKTPVGVVATSSVMDYNLLEESALTGDLIANSAVAMSYDTLAIKTLYEGADPNAQHDAPLFCTDSHVMEYLDCLPFDAGSSLIEYAQWDQGESFANLPNMLAESFVSMKAPAAGFDATPVAEFGVSAEVLANYALFYRFLVVESLKDDAKLLRVWRQHDHVNALNLDDVKSEYRTYIDGEIKRFGGLATVLAAPDAALGESLTARFNTLIDSPAYRTGLGGDGQPYAFTDTEVATMKATVAKAFAPMRDALALADSQILSDAKKIIDHALADDLAGLMKARIEAIVMPTSGNTTFNIQLPTAADDDDGTQQVTVTLPTFVYSQKTRLAAAALLAEKRGLAPEWGLSEAKATADAFATSMKAALTVDIGDIDNATMPKAVARWVIDNKAVLAALKGE